MLEFGMLDPKKKPLSYKGQATCCVIQFGTIQLTSRSWTASRSDNQLGGLYWRSLDAAKPRPRPQQVLIHNLPYSPVENH